MFRIFIRMRNDEVSILYDLGGVAFETTILCESNGKIDFIGNEGNVALSRENIDVAFYEYVLKRNLENISELRDICKDKEQ